MTRNKLLIATGTALAAALTFAPGASAAANPFSAMPLASGYRLSDNSDMPAAKVADEAKCGAQKAKEMQETKCGTSKEEKAPPKVLKDASCGEAKCGANKRRRL